MSRKTRGREGDDGYELLVKLVDECAMEVIIQDPHMHKETVKSQEREMLPRRRYRFHHSRVNI